MAPTLIFGAICAAGLVFMLWFLVAICGVAGEAARIGYAVQIKPGSVGGEGDGKHKDAGVMKAPPIPAPVEERSPEYSDIPVWQHSPVFANGRGSNASRPLSGDWICKI